MPLHVLATHLCNTSFEPQRQHNWDFRVYGLPGLDQDMVSLSLASGFLPRVSNEELAIPYGNEYVFVAGKALHDAGAIIVRDWCDRDVAAGLMRWRMRVYDPYTGAIGLARDYKKVGELILFGPNVGEFGSYAGADNGFAADSPAVANVRPPTMRSWLLLGCWPISFNAAYNGLDMGSSAQVVIEMAIRYDKALPVDLFTRGSSTGGIVGKIAGSVGGSLGRRIFGSIGAEVGF